MCCKMGPAFILLMDYRIYFIFCSIWPQILLFIQAKGKKGRMKRTEEDRPQEIKAYKNDRVRETHENL